MVFGFGKNTSTHKKKKKKEKKKQAALLIHASPPKSRKIRLIGATLSTDVSMVTVIIRPESRSNPKWLDRARCNGLDILCRELMRCFRRR